MIDDRLRRYLDLKTQLTEIESQIDALRPAVLDYIRNTGSRSITAHGFDFIASRLTTWNFSSAVEKLQAALSEIKREEKTTGVATVKEEKDVLIVRRHRDRKRDSAVDEKSLRQVRKTHPRAYEKWTVEEDDVLRSAFHEGQTIAEIAAHLQRQPGGIRSRLCKHGLIEK
ncbi:MAG TPA: hypothetical protein PKI11_10470 [Candidatus Hydrogenedentes bacterium]|nr:hypothetical protein [Candidatus Hydrogenedentota bacterium]HNT86251.1 hypothetical protein [Candidatus Hydrogenedentota bacterium]